MVSQKWQSKGPGIGLVVLVLLMLPGISGAQQPVNDEKMAERAILNMILNETAGTNKCLKQRVSGQLDKDDRSFLKLADSYLVGACYSKTTQHVLSNELENLADAKVQAKSAAQVTQAATEGAMKLQAYQVAQNQRIIQLLEELLRKP